MPGEGVSLEPDKYDCWEPGCDELAPSWEGQWMFCDDHVDDHSVNDETLEDLLEADLEMALLAGHTLADKVWSKIPLWIVQPNYGYKCSDCGDVHRGEQFDVAPNGSARCPDREHRPIKDFIDI